MQRLKDEGLDPSKPDFSSHSRRPDTANFIHAKPPDKISMIRPDITKKIGQAELESDKAKEEAWFVVCGEVKSPLPPLIERWMLIDRMVIDVRCTSGANSSRIIQVVRLPSSL